MKSVSANWAVLRNSSRSRSCVTDFSRDVASTSVVYWIYKVSWKYFVKKYRRTIPDSCILCASLTFLLMIARPRPLGFGFLTALAGYLTSDEYEHRSVNSWNIACHYFQVSKRKKQKVLAPWYHVIINLFVQKLSSSSQTTASLLSSVNKKKHFSRSSVLSPLEWFSLFFTLKGSDDIRAIAATNKLRLQKIKIKRVSKVGCAYNLIKNSSQLQVAYEQNWTCTQWAAWCIQLHIGSGVR